MNCGIATFAAVIALTGGASAQVLGDLYAVDAWGGEFLRVDVATGAGTTIATPNAGFGIAIDGNGNAFARTGSEVFDIDLTTGTLGNARGTQNGVTALEFSADGSVLYSISQGSGDFFSLDISTGTTTLIGNANHIGGNKVGLALNRSNGNMYLAGTTNVLAEFDPTTGNLVSTVSLSYAGGGETLGFTAIATDASNNLYGVGTLSDGLYSINASTGVATFVGFVGGEFRDIRGLSFVIPAPASVAGFAGLAVFATRRRA